MRLVGMRVGLAAALVARLGHGTVRPHMYVITCADGNDYLARMHWSSWRPTARGHGTEKVNSCIPDCANGKFHNYPVRAVFWRARPRPGRARQRFYSRLSLTYTRKVPRGFHRHRTIDLRPAI